MDLRPSLVPRMGLALQQIKGKDVEALKKFREALERDTSHVNGDDRHEQ